MTPEETTEVMDQIGEAGSSEDIAELLENLVDGKINEALRQ